jgi:hypothetical protein
MIHIRLFSFFARFLAVKPDTFGRNQSRDYEWLELWISSIKQAWRDYARYAAVRESTNCLCRACRDFESHEGHEFNS